MLAGGLWKQFETPLMGSCFGRYEGLATPPFLIGEQMIAGLLGSLEVLDRLFLVGTLWSIEHNLSQFRECLTGFTRGRLYSYLWDLCLLAEKLMRQEALARRWFPDPTVRLCSLIQKACSHLGIQTVQPGGEPRLVATDMPSLVDGLGYALDSTKFNFVDRAMRCLYIVRNFAGHHFNVSQPLLDPHGQPLHDDLFDLYDEVLAHIAILPLYLRGKGLI